MFMFYENFKILCFYVGCEMIWNKYFVGKFEYGMLILNIIMLNDK